MGIPYICPMHAGVHSPEAGKCSVCGMQLVRSDSRFPLLQHLLANPVHLAVMVAVMIAIMAGAMMFLR